MPEEEKDNEKDRLQQEEDARTASGNRWLRPVRKHLRKVWLDGGGGYYGLGYLGMFVWLELSMIAEDITEIAAVIQSPEAGQALVGAILGQIFWAFIETLINGLMAGLWPFLIMGDIGFWPTMGLILVTYFLYHNLLRDPLGEWLGFDLTVEDDEDDTDDDTEPPEDKGPNRKS